MKHNIKKLLCATLTMSMLLSLAACSSSTPAPAEPAKEEAVETETPADEAAPAEAETPAETETTTEPEAAADAAANAAYTNEGFTLTVPGKYDGLLFTTTPEEDGTGTLFMCSEIASIEAAQAQERDIDGAGWLFSIRKIDEAALNQKLCDDMSGEQPFATDGNGNYFLFCTPTDVRLIRDNYDNPEDMEIWTELNEWAATVPDTFLSENPQLTAAKFGNTDIDMHLARIAFDADANYTISTLEFLELEPKDVDPAPYLEKLRNNVTYVPVEEEAPAGEYVVLAFPDEGVRFDFFFVEDGRNYIREVWGEDSEWEKLYRADFEDESIDATEVMAEWYDALAVANGKK